MIVNSQLLDLTQIARMAVSSPSSFDLSTTLDIFMLLMLSRFYFCGDEGVGSGTLIDIVQQMRGDRGVEIRRVHPGAARRDIVPLLLGETYHGIDRLSGGSEFMGSGSPALLLLWLYERLDLARCRAGGAGCQTMDEETASGGRASGGKELAQADILV